jgi:hypothetical protein
MITMFSFSVVKIKMHARIIAMISINAPYAPPSPFFQGLVLWPRALPSRVPVLSRLWGRTQGFCPPPPPVVVTSSTTTPECRLRLKRCWSTNRLKRRRQTPSPTGQHTRGLWGSNSNRAKHPPRPPSTTTSPVAGLMENTRRPGGPTQSSTPNTPGPCPRASCRPTIPSTLTWFYTFPHWSSPYTCHPPVTPNYVTS